MKTRRSRWLSGERVFEDWESGEEIKKEKAVPSLPTLRAEGWQKTLVGFLAWSPKTPDRLGTGKNEVIYSATLELLRWK